MINRGDARTVEQRGSTRFMTCAVGEHVRHAAGHTKVIFQYEKLAIRRPDKIGTANRDVVIPRDRQAAHLTTVMAAGIDNILRDNLVSENLALVIHVAQKWFSAVMRCVRPRSTTDHSALVITRGIMSYGKICSVPSPRPYTVNVIPW